MEISHLVGNLLENISEDDLLRHLTKATFYELWAWEVLLNALEVKKKSDLLTLEDNLVWNYFAVATMYEQNQPYDKWVREEIMKTLEEECSCARFKHSIIKEAFRLGFYPMSITLWDTDFLTIRHHLIKTIITFDQLHIPKNTARYIRNGFANYTMTFNRDFHQCLHALTEAYPETWLCPKLVEAFETIHTTPTPYVSIDSVEIWNEKGELVAGEVGFITGNVYASLSGFHKERNIGTVQMSLLGLFLKHNGFAYWDLGMSLPYKYRYGAVDCDRQQQAALWAKRKKTRNILPTTAISLGELWARCNDR